jgi:hypothetical protein
VRVGVDQLPEDRVGTAQELPRRWIGDRRAARALAFMLCALGSQNAGHRVCLGGQGRSFISLSLSTISTICGTVSVRFQSR